MKNKSKPGSAARAPRAKTAKPKKNPKSINSPRSRGEKNTRGSEIVIPDKLFFRIGDVADLLDMPAYVLRFWETEFPQLKPSKSTTGQRLYRKREVETALHIRKLLYDEGFTIAGARQQMRMETKGKKAQGGLPFPPAAKSPGEFGELRHNLREILALLSSRR